MSYPKIIQGGMGVAASDWCLAKAVSMAGQLGVVSGTALDTVMSVRLRLGDVQGNIRRGLQNFPVKEVGQKIIDKFYNTTESLSRKLKYEMHSVKSDSKMTDEKEDEIVAATFTEVYLAKEGHKGIVGINLLEKIQLPNIAAIYGSLLAGVDYIIMGAGIPRDFPAIIEDLVEHKPVEYTLSVAGATSDDKYTLKFDPSRYGLTHMKLKKPKFLAIISSNILALTLAKKSKVKPDGFIVETAIAGGHNAPPRVQGVLNDNGEPIYGDKDVVDLVKLKELGLPFWLAGGYGRKGMVQEALDNGAEGVQVGTIFALCKESGMREDIKKRVLAEDPVIKTDPLASPTGYPFKVAQMKGTVVDPEVYAARKRVCNIGMLRTAYKKDDGSLGFRCGAEKPENYIAKGGLEEETVGRCCLCHGLLSAGGLGLEMSNGEVEPPIVTMGDDSHLYAGREYGFTATDVIDELLEGVKA